jgi:hypothetical protein
MKILENKDSIKKSIEQKWKSLCSEAEFFSGNKTKVSSYLGYDTGYFSGAIYSAIEDMQEIAKEISKLEEQYNKEDK